MGRIVGTGPRKRRDNRLDIGAQLVLARLDLISETLNRAYPEKQKKWYSHLLYKIQLVVKYVALPSLILAAIIPLSDLFTSVIERFNRDYIQSQYVSYSSNLLAQNLPDRANQILNQLENLKNLNSETQYVKAKILAFQAIRQGRNLDNARDAINILLSLSQNPPFFFPDIAKPQEIWRLRLALIDIDIQNGRQDLARPRLEALAKEERGRPHRWAHDEILLKEATIDVLEYRYEEAEKTLIGLLKSYNKPSSNPSETAAEIFFQYGKVLLFKRDLDGAENMTNKAYDLFDLLDSDYGRLRAANNLGIVDSWKKDFDKAFEHYKESERISRKINNLRGLARSLTNLGTIYRNRNENEKARAAHLEALAVFRDSGNKLGMAAAAHNLVSGYKDEGHLGEALKYAKIAYNADIDLNEIRGLASAAGHVGDLYRELGIYDGAVFYNLLSYILNRHLNKPDKANTILSILQSLRSLLGVEKFQKLLEEAQEKMNKLLMSLERSDIDKSLPSVLISSVE